MRKIFLLLLAITGTILAYSQSPAPDSIAFREYTGRYVFPDGSQVAEMKVVFENGILSASSEQGSSELKRLEKDVFDVVAYTGTATFKRDEKGKVNAVLIEIGDIILDGKKEQDAPGYTMR